MFQKLTEYNIYNKKIMKFWQKKPQKPISMPGSSFKSTYSLAQRVEKRASLKQKYPDGQFCVLVVEGLTNLPYTGKMPKPYILMGLQRTMNILHLIGYIKKILHIKESASLFVESGTSVVSMTATMAELQDRFVDQDGFVYLRIRTQDSF